MSHFGNRRVQSINDSIHENEFQHLPEEFWLLWNARENADFVFGTRKSREDGAFRRMITGFMRFVNFAIWGVWVRDANCPFKLMRREKLIEVLARIPRTAFIPMVHFSMIARKLNLRVVEIPVTHLPRRAGATTLRGLGRWMRIGMHCVAEIVSVRLNWRRQ